MYKRVMFSLLGLGLSGANAFAQMTQPGGSLPGSQGAQTPYVQSPQLSAPSVQNSPSFAPATPGNSQPVIPPQVPGSMPSGTSAPFGTPNGAVSPNGGVVNK